MEVGKRDGMGMTVCGLRREEGEIYTVREARKVLRKFSVDQRGGEGERRTRWKEGGKGKRRRCAMRDTRYEEIHTFEEIGRH